MKWTLSAVIVALSATAAHADLRSFTYTYEYSTVPAGDTSLQFWHTQRRFNDEPRDIDGYEGVLELEHGLTDKLDAGFYTFVSSTAYRDGESTGLEMSRVELQTRYRISERGELPVDTQLMVTVGRLFGTSVFSFSGRAIAARDFGDLTVAANIEGELIAGNSITGTEMYLRWMAGATYAVHPRVRVGAETWAVMIDRTSYVDAGPSLSFAASPKFWVALTVGFAVTKRDALVDSEHGAYSGRAIFGIEL